MTINCIRIYKGILRFFSFLKLSPIFASIFLSLFNTAYSAQVTLSIDSPDTAAAGCKLYYGTSSGKYSSCIDIGKATNHTVPDLVEGQTYYFAAKAYSSFGFESPFSNETYQYIPKSDSDGDGIPDSDEINVYNTNPKLGDTDGDGLTDADEINVFYTNPNDPDTDEDGYLDGEEILVYKTNPNNSDTNGNGILDGQEDLMDGNEKTALIIDNADPGFSSGPNTWPRSSFSPGGYENVYQYAAPGDGKKWARWMFTLPVSASCEVFAQWTVASNRSTAAPYTIISNGSRITVSVDQTLNGGQFVSLGTYHLEAGTVEIILSESPTGHVIADAVMIVCGAETLKQNDDALIDEIIIDNSGEEFMSGPGEWAQSSYIAGYCGKNYQYAPALADGKWAKWAFSLPVSGFFEVYAQWAAASNRSKAAPFSIINNNNKSSVSLDQTINGGEFVSMGTYWFEAGSVEVLLNSTSSGVVIADAIKISRR